MTWEEAAILDNMHRGFARYDKYVAELQAQLEGLQHCLSVTQQNLLRAKDTLLKSQAHAQGLSAQVSQLAAALRKVDPSAHPLKMTSDTWPVGSQFEGARISVAGVTYVQAVKNYLTANGVTAADFSKYYV